MVRKLTSKRLSAVAISTISSGKKSNNVLKNYQPLERLGQGSFATVRLYQHTQTLVKYAVKKMDRRILRGKRFGGSTLTAADLIIEEMKVLQQLEHPNLIWLHEIINDSDGHAYLVTQYYPNGSLGDELRRINAN
jgi:serine/threonine protein kinase